MQEAGNSEEDEEMEDMDDEAMFRMDEHVAAVLRARRDAQPSNARRAVTEFRFRALALLDEYVKRCPGSPHLPSLLGPLLKALTQASNPVVPSEGGKAGSAKQPGNPALAGRIQVCALRCDWIINPMLCQCCSESRCPWHRLSLYDGPVANEVSALIQRLWISLRLSHLEVAIWFLQICQAILPLQAA